MHFYNQERKGGQMSNKDIICELYFSQHQKQQDIATASGVSQQYVSKVIRLDSRYKQEKETRKQENQENRRNKQAKYIKSKKEQEIRELEHLKYLQNCNSKEMSKRYLPNSEELTKYEKALYRIGNKNICRLPRHC